MRPITLRFETECHKCAAALAIGAPAVYERRVGAFCPTCAPTDPEEIRALRTVGAEKKAKKYEEWAAKRKAAAEAVFAKNEPFTGDYAFNTQPGHIPARARIIAQEDRAMESMQTARRFEAKASSLRNVVVAGDKERRRQAEREVVLKTLKVGSRVHTALYGKATVVRVNKKTATVDNDSGYNTKVDLSWITILDGQGA
jgi:hypothetical protein